MRLYPFVLIPVLLAACKSEHVDGLFAQVGTKAPISNNAEEPLHFGVGYFNGKRTDTVALGVSEFEGKVYFFETTEAVLNGTPRWKTNADFPPLSPRKAEAAARNEALRLRPDIEEWLLESIKLRKVLDECLH